MFFIEIHNAKKQQMIIGELYRLPNHDVDWFNVSFNTLLTKLEKENAKFLLAVDYNINLINHESALESGSHLDYLNIYNNNSIFVLPVTSSEICDVTATFKFNKSAGYDNISPNAIKSITKNIALPLLWCL